MCSRWQIVKAPFVFASVVEQGILSDGLVVGQRNKGNVQEDKQGMSDNVNCCQVPAEGLWRRR